MERPMVLEVRKKGLEEREPPNPREYDFVEARPPIAPKGIIDRVRSFLRL